MFDRLERRINRAKAAVVQMVRTAVALVLTTIFAVVSILALIAASPEILEFFDGGCGTDLCCEDCRTVPVSRIIDGDTFVSGSNRVRLFGVDAPEVGEPCSEEATARLRRLAGDAVRVEEGSRRIDSFQRLLLYVYTRSGRSIDETLINEGLAVAWTDDGQHRDRLVAVQETARGRGAGCLW